MPRVTIPLAALVLAANIFVADAAPGPAGCCGGSSGVTPPQVDQQDPASSEAQTPETNAPGP